MIIKLFGILDILVGMFFWISAFFQIIPDSLIILSALYLIAKGVGFLISEHFASITDIIAGAIIFASLSFAIPSVIVIIVSIYLLQKGIFSLL